MVHQNQNSPPSGKFNIDYRKPFSGYTMDHIEIIGNDNGPSNIVHTVKTSEGSMTVKKGELDIEESNDLVAMLNEFKGAPTSSKDIYGKDVKIDFHLGDALEWNSAVDSEDSAVAETTAESKDKFSRMVDEIQELARKRAKKDAAI